MEDREQQIEAWLTEHKDVSKELLHTGKKNQAKKKADREGYSQHINARAKPYWVQSSSTESKATASLREKKTYQDILKAHPWTWLITLNAARGSDGRYDVADHKKRVKKFVGCLRRAGGRMSEPFYEARDSQDRFFPHHHILLSGIAVSQQARWVWKAENDYRFKFAKCEIEPPEDRAATAVYCSKKT